MSVLLLWQASKLEGGLTEAACGARPSHFICQAMVYCRPLARIIPPWHPADLC